MQLDASLVPERCATSGMSTQELEERSLPGRTGRLLRALRLPVTAGAGALPLLLGGVTLGSLCLAGALAIASWLGINALVQRPLRPYQAELAYRAWRDGTGVLPPPAQQDRWLRERLTSSDAPDWLLILSGRFLPHGGTFWIGAALRGNAGQLEFRHEQRDGNGARHTYALDPTQRAQLGEQLATFPDAFSSSARFEVIDGIPCDLVIVSREPAIRRDLSCNLAGREESAVKAVCRTLYGLGARELAAPQRFGACDRDGNITIGTR